MSPVDEVLIPQRVSRGDAGPTYVARKPPVALVAHLCGLGESILVLRCHDGDVALAAVCVAVEDDSVPADLAEALIVDPSTDVGNDEIEIPTASQIWVRYVPDDYDDPNAGGSYERELRGTVGATPAVLFSNRLALVTPTEGTPA